MSIQTRIQSLQLPTAGLRPATGARLPGTLYVNLPDSQLGVIAPLKTPVDLLPVRFFSTLASYFAGAYVRNGGFLYRCIANVTPGPFNPAQWVQVLTFADVVGVYMPIAGGTFTGPIHAPSGSSIVGYMPLTGGVFTGPVTLPPGSTVSGYMPLTGGSFTGPIIAPAGSVIVGYVPASGGNFTGAVHLPTGSTITGYLPLSGGSMDVGATVVLGRDPVSALDAATKQYVDSFTGSGGGGSPGTGVFLPLAGGTMTGPITMSETLMAFDGAAGSANRVISTLTNGVKRWDFLLGTPLAETGANAGCNFGVIAYDDSGAPLSSWNTNRASGRLTFNGVAAAPHTVTNYPPDVGSATIVLNRQGSGHNCGVVASSAGLNRWGLNLSDMTPESTGNQGSNFSLTGYADDGHATLGEVDFNRMSMRMSLNGVGATPHSVTAYPPDVGSATIVLNRQGSGHNCGIVASSGGLNRWALNLSDMNAEGSGDSGSDLDIIGYKQDGHTFTGSLNFMRANGRLSLNGVGATPRALSQYPPTVGNANFVLNSAPNFDSSITASNHGLNRWQLIMGDGTPESGSNQGSNMALNYSNDAGNFLGSAITIRRQTGQVTFAVPPAGVSDRRQKSVIEPIRHALASVAMLTGVTYQRDGALKREMGLIAQDVEPVLPEVVRETGQPLDPEGKEIKDVEPLLGIAYGNIVALLIEAIKELSAKVTALQEKAA